MVLKCEKIFESMKPYVESKKDELTKRINAVYAFEVAPAKGKKVEKIWTVDLKKGFIIILIAGDILEGRQGNIDATFILTDGDLINMATGKLNPQQAFMQV